MEYINHMVEGKELSVEFLSKHKFYDPRFTDHDEYWAAEYSCITVKEEDILMIENNWAWRQAFAVVFVKCKDYWAHEIWVKEDIGCDMLQIPGNWATFTESGFIALYESIRRVKFPEQTPIFNSTTSPF